MVLPNCPWELVYAILDTGAGPNIIQSDAIDPSWKVTIRNVKPRVLRSAASTPLRVIGTIRLVIHVGQLATNTSLSVVKSLAVGVLLDTAFIERNVKSISPGKKLINSIKSSTVAIMGTVHEEDRFANVCSVEEQLTICRVAKLSAIPALTKASATV